MADKEETEKTIAEDLVVTKYKMAGEIVNRILKQVLDKCIAGASVREICEFGDKLLTEETSKVFKKEKELKKGIAFPTCISVNNCICHFSPIASEPDLILKDEDMVKVDLGAHIDGFIAVVAHTIVISSSLEKKVTGRKADVVLAAHFASQAALRLLKPGTEVYAMDVLVSTGEGIGREQDTRVTIYKKTEETYQLKLKASRMFYSEVSHKHGLMPFNLRTFEDEKKAKMAVVECVNHRLIEPFQVLYEKPNEYAAQFKFTVLLMPNGPHKITGIPFDLDIYQSDCVVDDPELKNLLYSSANPKSAKKKKKKAEKAVDVAMEVDAKA
ncbi:proliferation-associated protein [Lasius niger]|uniref:Proliferation-associated protein n=1 Tax=Lasius niger TaxID=67767 RepID=A0A0J7KSM7_LASNI|nr:proliferation-associated protein [Lasius niger]